MKKYIILSHFINNDSAFLEYTRGLERISEAINLSNVNCLDIKFGLKLTVDEDNIERSLREKIKSSMKTLPDLNCLLYDSKNVGAGKSFRQILFNPGFSNSIIIHACLDQYTIETKDSLDRLSELAAKVEQDNSLYAVGSRNVPVILATNHRNSNLRIIHELFHSLTIGDDKLRIPEKMNNITPAYASLGESTSGLDVLNSAHLMYPQLAKDVLISSQTANMDGFAIAYYTAIKSSQLGGISVGYVNSTENKFYATRSASEELEMIKNLISSQTRELGKTDIAKLISESIKSEDNIEKICRFYAREDVKLVRGWMEEGLSQGILE